MKDQSDARAPIRLTAPKDPQGYAAPDSEIGRFYAGAVNSAANEFQQFLPNAVTRSPEIEVGAVNEGFARMRAYISNRMMQYIIEHDGVVEAWPDPAAGLTFRFVNEDGELDSAESYHFNYFAEKYTADSYGASPPSGLQYRDSASFGGTAYGNYFNAEMSEAKHQFRQNNPMKFGWRVLMIYLVATLLICPILSAIYLALLQFVVSDPEAVGASVNAIMKLPLGLVQSNPAWLESLPAWLCVPLKMIATLVGLILFLVPFLMVFLPDLLYGLAGSSVLSTVIYGVLVIGFGLIALRYVWAFLGKKFPKANLMEGLKGGHRYLQLATSSERGAVKAGERQARKDFEQLSEAFHKQWYAYVMQQTGGQVEFRPKRVVSVTVKGMSHDEYREHRAERDAELAALRRDEEALDARKAALRDEIESRERDFDILAGGSGSTAEEKMLRGDISYADYANYESRKEEWVDKKSKED